MIQNQSNIPIILIIARHPDPEWRQLPWLMLHVNARTSDRCEYVRARRTRRPSLFWCCNDGRRTLARKPSAFHLSVVSTSFKNRMRCFCVAINLLSKTRIFICIRWDPLSIGFGLKNVVNIYILVYIVDRNFEFCFSQTQIQIVLLWCLNSW